MESSRSSAALRAASWSSSIAASTACSASLLQGALRPGNSRSAVEETVGDADVIPGRFLPVRVSEQGRGVVGHDHRNTPEAVDFAPQRAERLLRVQERLRRGVPHREDDARRQELDLPKQVRNAGGNLVVLRGAILGWPALHHIADIYLLPLEADGGEDLGEQLPGLANERATSLVFRLPGTLADHHEPRAIRSFTGDRVGACFAQPALGASAHEIGDLGEGRRALDGIGAEEILGGGVEGETARW